MTSNDVSPPQSPPEPSAGVSPTMTVPELAARIGVHDSTAWRYLRAGTLPGVQAGSSWIIDRARVERFIAGLEDVAGRPLVHAPPPDPPALTLLPEREPATAELALHWLRGARAAFDMLFSAAEQLGSAGATQQPATERHSIGA